MKQALLAILGIFIMAVLVFNFHISNEAIGIAKKYKNEAIEYKKALLETVDAYECIK